MSESQEHKPQGEANVLGLARWVQFAYVAFALVLFWLLGHLIRSVWSFFREPRDIVVSATAALVAVLVSFALYKKASVNTWSHDVSAEVAQVTWPSRPEAWNSTLVVIVTSVIAAVILFGLDSLWFSASNLIYGS